MTRHIIAPENSGPPSTTYCFPEVQKKKKKSREKKKKNRWHHTLSLNTMTFLQTPPLDLVAKVAIYP